MNACKRDRAPLGWRAPPKAANAKQDLQRRPQLEELEDRATPSITFSAYSSVSDYSHLASGPGVYAYNSNTGRWRILTTSLPSQMTEGADGVLYGGFSDGTWRYDYNSGYSGNWSRISPLRPRAMDASPDDTLAVSYDYYGTWEYHGTYAYWTLMTPSTAMSIAEARNDQAYASFAGAGTFEYLSGTWYWLTGSTATTLAASQNGLGFASFYGGTWMWSNTSGWKLLAQQSTALAAYTSSWGTTYLCGSFYGSGTFETNVSYGTWTSMTNTTTSQVGYDNLYDIYAAYGNGLFKWDGSWKQVDTNMPSLVAA
jgi:hypothetical protein